MSAAEESAARCRRYRRKILDMSQRVSALHIGGAFSCIEILDTIYNNRLAAPEDTVILSKGHAGIAQYVILNDLGIISDAQIESYCTRGGEIGVHPTLGNPGISASTGSLGHGLGMAVGMALAERAQGKRNHIWCVLSDGECMEGSTWEAVIQAAAFELQNLHVVVDNNDRVSFDAISASHPNLYPLYAKFKAFGWLAEEANGHDPADIFDAFVGMPCARGRPSCVVASTVKGKGVKFMENVAQWHYRSPTPAEYQRALVELEGIRQ